MEKDSPSPYLMVDKERLEESVPKARSRLGLVQVYTGEGKGKTTASIGLMLRAAGHGLRGGMVQFLKSGYTGEVLFCLAHPELQIEIISYGKRCKNHARHMEDIRKGLFESFCRECFSITEEDKEFCAEALKRAKGMASSGEYDLVVLDEINVAISLGLVGVDSVLSLIRGKDKKTELVLTGRNAPKELLKVADSVSLVSFEKHPYDRGIPARKGIEF